MPLLFNFIPKCLFWIQLPLDDTFLRTLLNWVLDVADSDLQRLSALHIVASTVNRRAEGWACFHLVPFLSC
jgi:hypothetical protein